MNKNQIITIERLNQDKKYIYSEGRVLTNGKYRRGFTIETNDEVISGWQTIHKNGKFNETIQRTSRKSDIKTQRVLMDR